MEDVKEKYRMATEGGKVNRKRHDEWTSEETF